MAKKSGKAGGAYPGEKSQAGGGGPDHTSPQDAKMGNITSAASSSMKPADFSRGYRANEGELLNKNFADKGRKG
jgi:hypothetical protein